MENIKNGNSVAWKWIPIAAGIGMATGAAVGLLYAPKAGKETRRYIREKARQLTRRV